MLKIYTEIDLITKREVLRESSKIYDPLGIISPVTVRGKMVMQTLWGENMKWDEPLPDHMRTEWIDIRRDINQATKTVIHQYRRNNGKDNQTINVEDVVQVYEESSRTKWNLAVMDQLNIEGDGKMRSAVIRTKNGLTSCPITKLYPLEVSAYRDFIIDNTCDINYPSSSRNLSRKAKSVAMENIKI
ncbi:unnamed protein product [Mytilus coruscus]|uniref:Uncharacterized protein n=1 Tax=Mytilus coruscus TaxID=42192 RepID=A0A6J8BQ06_MYTCO|nr:unnamed protein product [Mytilus coruscus]